MSVEKLIQRVIRVLLDVGCVAVGLGGIWWQTVKVPPGQASEALLVAYVSILGIPAGVGLLSLRSTGSTGTTSSGSSSPGPDSPQPQSSSPSVTPGGEAQ